MAGAGMNVWSLLDDTSNASEPAFDTYVHDAAQLVDGGVARCVGLGVVSFNFGMPQSMLEADRRWNNTHVFRFRDVLEGLGNAAGSDFVFGSEVGEKRQRLRAANVDFEHIVQEALPGATCSSSGAYLHVWNVRQQAAALVQSGTWTAPSGQVTDLHWQAFDLTYRDASQLADLDAFQLAELVGNMHIPVGSSKVPTQATRRRIVEQALQYLTHLEVSEWSICSSVLPSPTP